MLNVARGVYSKVRLLGLLREDVVGVGVANVATAGSLDESVEVEGSQ